MLERRQRRRGELGQVQAQAGAQFGLHDSGQGRVHLRRVRPAHGGDVGANDRLLRPSGNPRRVTWAEPVQRRQERPLVLVRLEGCEVEEHRQPVLATSSLQGGGDEVAEATFGQHILVGEEAIVAAQVHRSTHQHGLV
jgi:hypothetical protein